MFFFRSNSIHNTDLSLFFPGQRARRDVKGTKMAQYLAEELLDSEGEPVKKACAAIKKRPQARKSNKKVKHNVDPGPADDTKSSNDGDFFWDLQRVTLQQITNP